MSLVTSAQQIFELCAGETKTVTYFSTSTGDGTTSWMVNGTTYNVDELTYTYDSEGTYNIVVKKENGPCYVEQTLQVIVSECPDMIYYIPNSFTPDGDEHNNTFKWIFTSGFDPMGFNILIYNRWGELIFESNNHMSYWDGTYGDKICQSGTYTYKVRFKDAKTDKKYLLTGHVNLIK